MEKDLKTEKMTVNISTLDLAKIDLLVDSLEYANRSDFCRIAIRELLEKHKEDFERLQRQNETVQFRPGHPVVGGIGLIYLSHEALEEAALKGQKVNVMVTGILMVDQGVTPQLIDSTVQAAKIRGKIQAAPEIAAALKRKERR